MQRFHEGRRRLARQGFRQRPPGAGRVDVLGRIAREGFFPHEMTIEAAHGRQTTGDARRLQSSRPGMLEVGNDIVGADLRQPVSPTDEKAIEVGEVAAVGGQGVSGHPPLRLESPEKPGHGIHQSIRGAVRPWRRASRVTTSESITLADAGARSR